MHPAKQQFIIYMRENLSLLLKIRSILTFSSATMYVTVKSMFFSTALVAMVFFRTNVQLNQKQ